MCAATLLIAEDEGIVALDLRERLTRLGYAVFAPAASGEEAFQRAIETRPDLVLMDIRLSGEMDGVDAALQIRARFDIPVVFLTAHADDETLTRAKLAEPYGYLVKPFEERELYTTIELALAKHRQNAVLKQLNAALVAEVAQRKHAESKLEDERRLLRTLIDHLPDYVFIKDRESRIIINNAAHAVTLLGASSPEVTVGKTDFDFFPEALAKRYFGQEQALMESGQALLGSEEPSLDRHGNARWHLTTKVPLRGGEGNVVGLVGIARDITERKEAEELLRQRANELQARNAELDAFAHTVAHDLKGPLQSVLGLAAVLEMDLALLPVEQANDYLRMIVRSARKMSDIIDDLLLLAMVRTTEVELEPLATAEMVAEALKRVSQLSEALDADILVPETWAEAQGYAPWVEEVWFNYLSNALHYGGRPPRVELGSDVIEMGNMVRFWVRDNGEGISPVDQDRLFVPFTRLHQSDVSGHGLGLSIVRRIVERLGGEVGVESQLGEGSVFFFTLPRVDR